MTDIKLKNRIGLFLIAAHLLAILLLISLYGLSGFSFDDMTTAVALIVPIFAVHTTVIVQFFIKNQKASRRRGISMNPAFVTVAFAIPSVFVVLIVAGILLKSFNRLSFEQFKLMITLLELIFAVYIGQFISSLFEGAPG